MSSDANYTPDSSNQVSRIAERAAYDKATIHAILDAGYFCHIGFIANGKPVVMPMTYWREGEHVYFHSANKGRFAQACAEGEICLTVSHFDGLVLGHSAFNHSYNYRSVVVHGKPEVIADHGEKLTAMQSFVEHVIPGRWEHLRPLRDNEIRSITLMRIKLDQVSAKVRDDFPDAEEVEPNWPVWVGVLPAVTAFAAPVADPARNKINPAPRHVAGYFGNDNHIPHYHAGCAD
jgi:nitroimidazol reductase NimA-like FMN-containing flavoprotein (pyridoxamine 5'-phosphate oxidase superfamily)